MTHRKAVDRLILGLCAFALCSPLPSAADTPPPLLDPAVSAALAQISAAELRTTDTRLVGFGTRSTYSDHAPAGRGVFAARAYLVARFRAIAARSGGRMTVATDDYLQVADPAKRVPRDVPISSVIATLKGDNPSGRTYVISSHYDSRNTNNDDGSADAPGADDNGSGTAAVLETARVLAALPMHATVVFACFEAEEQGLFGSTHFANDLAAKHVDVEGDLNNDIIGASVGDDGIARPDIVRIFSEALPIGATLSRVNAVGGENDSPSRELARFAKETGDAYVAGIHGVLVYRADRFLRGGDHESFNAAGFPAIRFVEPVETFAHEHQNVRTENGVRYGDLLQFEDFDYLAQVTRYNASVLASLALAPAPPKVSILTKELTNATTLSWTNVPGAVRYEVLRRATTEATWTNVSPAIDEATVPNGALTFTTITLPFSKDDWIFGVRSVDAQGHRSVAAYPTPMR